MAKGDSTSADTKDYPPAKQAPSGQTQTPTKGRIVLYSDGTGETHAAVVAKANSSTDVMLWILHCDEHPHPAPRFDHVEYDAAGAPGTWAWPPRV